MAIHRGLQSAIFYYLSCAPCADRRYKKKMRLEAEHNRAARDALADEMPNFYRQPCPSTTNPWWQREIEAGPSYNPRPKRPISPSQIGYKLRPSGDTSGVPSSVTLASGKGSHSISSHSQVASFQREDEQLWGSRTNVGLQRPSKAYTKDPPHVDFQNYRNPAVSDMHPAIATRVTSRNEVLWMMQPPPVAEVMNGKERPTRYDRGHPSPRLAPHSRPTTRQSSKLSNYTASHIDEEAVTEAVEDEEAIENQPELNKDGFRSAAAVAEHDFAPRPLSMRRHSSFATQSTENDSISYHQLDGSTSLGPTVSRKLAARPHLPTIMSETITSRSTRHDSALLPSPIFTRASKENISPGLTKVDSKGHGITQTSTMMVNENGLVFDGMLPDEADLPTWIHEHTKREVQKRWSMDL